LRIAGIDIDLHWTFLLLIALVLIAGGLESVIIATILFGSVVLHELSHSIIARLHKVDVTRIVLLPIVGMAVLDEFAMPPEVELKVSVAGPALSLLLAILAYAVELASPFPWLAAIAAVAKEANILLCVFNILPAIPLDGGRVWRALRQRKRSFLLATREAVALSKFTVFAFLLFGIFLALFLGAWGFLFWSGLIALFIFVGSDMEWEAAVFKTASEGITVRDAMQRDIVCASGEETLLDAFELAYSAKVRNILLVRKHKYGVIPLAAFEGIPRKEWGRRKTKSISTVPLRCKPSDDVLGVWKNMRSLRVELAPVVENNKLVGIVTETDIERLIYLRKLALVS